MTSAIKFVVSGEPFIIPMDIIKKFPDTGIYSSAEFAIKQKVGDLSPNEYPVVELPRDYRAFRIIANYMTTGIPIIPSDPIDKTILMRECEFYLFVDYLAVLSKVYTIEEFSQIINKGKEKPEDGNETVGNRGENRGENKGEKKNEENTDSPSLSCLQKFGYVAPVDVKEEKAAESKDTIIFEYGKESMSSDQDDKITARERIARIMFAKGGENKSITPLLELFETKTEMKFGLCADYTYLKYPSRTGWPLPKLVSSADKYKHQLKVITFGVSELIRDLPLVIAGGCALYATFELPRRSFHPDVFDSSSPFIDNDIIHEFCHIYSNSEIHESRSYWRRREDETDNMADRLKSLEKKLKTASAEDKKEVKFSEEQKDTLELLLYITRTKFNASHRKLIHKSRAVGTLIAAIPDTEEDMIFKSFGASDIDLFITTRNPNEAFTAIMTLYDRLKNTLPKKVVDDMRVLRRENSITILLPRPYRKIQIITRLYHSVEHVLIGFDIDCCCIATNGQKVMCTERGMRAIRSGYNLVDRTRLSTSYENRVVKYMRRGFLTAIPGKIDVKFRLDAIGKKFDLFDEHRYNMGFAGLNLLLAMLESIRKNNTKIKSILLVKLSDYDENESVRHMMYRVVRGNVIPKFIYGSDMLAVLTSSKFEATIRRGSVQVTSILKSPIVFQTNLPHIQDRVDNLYTGSFQPIAEDDWFGTSEVTAK